MPDSDQAEAEATDANGQTTLFRPKRCFIASPIGADNSPERERSDLVREFIIDTALLPMGYETVRSDDIDKSGEITTQIISDLIDADLVIADLTGHNANVFYELAIRHAFKKPYIQMIEHDQSIPFDLRAIRTIHVDHQNLRSAASARDSIKSMVRDIEGGAEIQSPVTHAITRQQLETSQDPSKNELAQVAEAVERIESRMRLAEMDGLRSNSPGRYLPIIEELVSLVNRYGFSNDTMGYGDAEGLKKLSRRLRIGSVLELIERIDTEPPF
ncbi:hypothetical protein [Gordonia alkanivorans]|uniref:hypothetical protein n=1 Tax=Gordonia alkanivorans TaxID=84096 RepID=UPI002447B890|nr:hypothetical protein [Gordonia alkanivorans]MDH3045050.1 hypothetical protein [Gordonia alkanivorans]